MGEGLEHLRGRLDRGAVVELAAAERFPEGSTGDVLVGDVDVSLVPPEGVGALAGRVPQLGGGLGLAFGAWRGLALARDDLERHVEPVTLVTSKPDGARAAAAERPEGAVPAEHELALLRGCGGVRHGGFSLAQAAASPAPAAAADSDGGFGWYRGAGWPTDRGGARAAATRTRGLCPCVRLNCPAEPFYAKTTDRWTD